MEAGLINGEFTRLQSFDLRRDHIQAGYIVAQVSQTRARHQANISRPNNTNFAHYAISLDGLLSYCSAFRKDVPVYNRMSGRGAVIPSHYVKPASVSPVTT